MNTTRMMATAMLVIGSGSPPQLTAQTTLAGTESVAVAPASSSRRSTEGTSVRPFTAVHFPQDALDNLPRHARRYRITGVNRYMIRVYSARSRNIQGSSFEGEA